MTKPRETKYARELASAKLPSGPDGKSSVAIERLRVASSTGGTNRRRGRAS
jgi:hypothetical protein